MVTCITVGPFQENCYLFERDGELAIIDPGDEADRLLGAIAATGAKPRYILLTHCHLDHVGAAKDLQDRLGVPVYMPPEEQMLLDNLGMQCQLFGLPPMPAPRIDHLVPAGTALPLGSATITAVPTPGHSPGGTTYLVDDALAFVGDTIFQGSVGRTDLWGASWDVLEASIKERLFTLPDHITLYPGHGPETTVGSEKANNPFFSSPT